MPDTGSCGLREHTNASLWPVNDKGRASYRSSPASAAAPPCERTAHAGTCRCVPEAAQAANTPHRLSATKQIRLCLQQKPWCGHTTTADCGATPRMQHLTPTKPETSPPRVLCRPHTPPRIRRSAAPPLNISRVHAQDHTKGLGADLYRATERGDVAAMRKLALNGADPNWTNDVSHHAELIPTRIAKGHVTPVLRRSRSAMRWCTVRLMCLTQYDKPCSMCFDAWTHDSTDARHCTRRRARARSVPSMPSSR